MAEAASTVKAEAAAKVKIEVVAKARADAEAEAIRARVAAATATSSATGILTLPGLESLHGKVDILAAITSDLVQTLRDLQQKTLPSVQGAIISNEYAYQPKYRFINLLRLRGREPSTPLNMLTWNLTKRVKTKTKTTRRILMTKTHSPNPVVLMTMTMMVMTSSRSTELQSARLHLSVLLLVPPKQRRPLRKILLKNIIPQGVLKLRGRKSNKQKHLIVHCSRTMAATTTNDEAKISIKVLVDTEKSRVLYAEADHNFVDVLFSFMTLPMGAIVRLLGKQDDEKFEVFGSLNNLFQSLINLPDKYLCSEECKIMLLNPTSSAYDHCRKLKLNIDETVLTKYFICNNWECNNGWMSGCKLSACNSARCIHCGKLMNLEVRFKHETSSADDNSISNGVFVSDITTFVVTDDLCVMPYTPGCCIQLIRDGGITDTSLLEERSVDIGREQILDLLRFALSCSSPLTYLVLRKTNIHDLVHLEQGKLDQSTSIKKEVSSSDPKMFLHVSLQESTGKLLFTEAEEDFVDFVFGFLAISLGALIGKLMNGSSSLVCMDNLYRSISTLSTSRYLTSQTVKDILVGSHFGHRCTTKNHIFPLQGVTYCPIDMVLPANETHEWWNSCFLTFKGEGRTTTLNDPRVNGELFKHSGMFMVADDLVITPCSSVSTMDILKKLKVPLNDIEKHKFSIGLEEGLRMLKASMRSSSVLSIGLEDQLKKLYPNF